MEKKLFINLNGFDSNGMIVPLEITSGASDTDLDYLITSYCNSDTNYVDFINNNINSLYVFIKHCEQFPSIGDRHTYNQLKKMVDAKKTDLIWDCDCIIISGELNNIADFLDNSYGLFKDKKIIINNLVQVDNRSYSIIEEYFGKYPNLYYVVQGNMEAISLEDYKKTVDIIENVSDKVSKYNLSPIELVMYIYDITRDRFYVAEDNEVDSLETSRDLTKVLMGDKIVCAGFTKIFNSLLKKFNIPCQEFNLSYPEGAGHMRSIALIDDPKYKIKGFYIFDPTWDSKKDNKGTHLSSYRYFGKTFKQWESMELPDTEYDHFQLYTYDTVNHVKEVSHDGKVLFSSIFDYVDMIGLNKYREMLGMDKIKTSKVYDADEIIDTINRVIQLSRNHIKANDFIKIICNVRKIEYIEDQFKYPYDYNSILTAALRSKLVSLHYEEQLLLSAIFGKELIDINDSDLTKEEIIILGKRLAINDRLPEEIELVKKNVDRGITDINKMSLKKTK